MVDEPDNIVLIHLRRIDAKLDRLIDETADMKARLQTVETAVVDLRRDVVRLDHRLDGIDQRLSRIERRLDLVEA